MRGWEDSYVLRVEYLDINNHARMYIMIIISEEGKEKCWIFLKIRENLKNVRMHERKHKG